MYRLLLQALLVTLTFLMQGSLVFAEDAVQMRAEMPAGRPEIRVLSWDTEGGRRVETNLLRANMPLGLRLKMDGNWKPGSEFPASPQPAAWKLTSYRLSITAAVFAALEYPHRIGLRCG